MEDLRRDFREARDPVRSVGCSVIVRDESACGKVGSMDGLTSHPFWKIQRFEDIFTPIVVADLSREYASGAKVLSVDAIVKSVERGTWEVAYLMEEGRWAPELTLAQFPCTGDILEQLPVFMTGLGHVYFSKLAPGTRVRTQCGQINVKLRIFVPLHLTVDEDTLYCSQNGATLGRLKVGEEEQEFGIGDLLVFDDSFPHSMIINDHQACLALIIDVWHPDLLLHGRDKIRTEISELLDIKKRSVSEAWELLEPTFSTEHQSDSPAGPTAESTVPLITTTSVENKLSIPRKNCTGNQLHHPSHLPDPLDPFALISARDLMIHTHRDIDHHPRGADCRAQLAEVSSTAPGSTANPYLLKILFSGDRLTGKSSFLQRMGDESFIYSGEYHATIGVDFRIVKDYFFCDPLLDKNTPQRIKVQLWETAGSESFRRALSTYYHHAHGIFLCFDVCNRDSFTRAGGYWYDEIRLHRPGPVGMVLVGLKSDADDDDEEHHTAEKGRECLRQVSYAQGEELGRTLGIPYIECSARTNYRVQDALATLVHHSLRSLHTHGSPVLGTQLPKPTPKKASTPANCGIM